MGSRASLLTHSYQCYYLAYFLYSSMVADDRYPLKTLWVDDSVHDSYASRAAHCSRLFDLFLLHHSSLEMTLETCKTKGALPSILFTISLCETATMGLRVE